MLEYVTVLNYVIGAIVFVGLVCLIFGLLPIRMVHMFNLTAWVESGSKVVMCVPSTVRTVRRRDSVPIQEAIPPLNEAELARVYTALKRDPVRIVGSKITYTSVVDGSVWEARCNETGQLVPFVHLIGQVSGPPAPVARQGEVRKAIRSYLLYTVRRRKLIHDLDVYTHLPGFIGPTVAGTFAHCVTVSDGKLICRLQDGSIQRVDPMDFNPIQLTRYIGSQGWTSRGVRCTCTGVKDVKLILQDHDNFEVYERYADQFTGSPRV